MVTNPKSFIRTIFTSTIGCGCGRPKASEAYHPIPKSKPKTKNDRLISTRNGGSGGEEKVDGNTSAGAAITVSLNPKIGDSVAVVKESEDPYCDFRESMIQMVSEKQMFSKDELEELLDCFLHLNLPCHHDVIVRGFSEICNIILTRPEHLHS